MVDLIQQLKGQDLASVNKKVDVVEVKVEKQQEQINEIMKKFEDMNKRISGEKSNQNKQHQTTEEDENTRKTNNNTNNNNNNNDKNEKFVLTERDFVVFGSTTLFISVCVFVATVLLRR